jgi:hypothetical protein
MAYFWALQNVAVPMEIHQIPARRRLRKTPKYPGGFPSFCKMIDFFVIRGRFILDVPCALHSSSHGPLDR